MRTISTILVTLGLGLTALSTRAADNLPSDVRSNFWAASAVQQSIQNNLIPLLEDHQFHGEARVTRIQAVIALGRLARALQEGKWIPEPSVGLPEKAIKFQGPAGWQHQTITRYMLASTLTRMGNYAANGLARPKTDAKDLGQSAALPRAKVTVPKTNPAYDSLVYLAQNRMIWPGSVLLKPDNQWIQGGELSRALAEMAIGFNDRMTELGHNENGETPDQSFHKKPGGPPTEEKN